MMNLFEVTAKMMVEEDSGALKLKKRVIIVNCFTFTEAENVSLEYINSIAGNYKEHILIEGIKRIKISNIYLPPDKKDLDITEDAVKGMTEIIPVYEDEINFHELNIAFMELDNCGKEKIVKEKFLQAASSQKEAISLFEDELSETSLAWKVASGKETAIYSILLLNENTTPYVDKEEEDE